MYLLSSSKQLSWLKFQVLPTFCPTVLYFIWFIQRSNLLLFHKSKAKSLPQFAVQMCFNSKRRQVSQYTVEDFLQSHNTGSILFRNQRNIMAHCATVSQLVCENSFFQLFQWLFHTSIIHKKKIPVLIISLQHSYRLNLPWCTIMAQHSTHTYAESPHSELEGVNILWVINVTPCIFPSPINNTMSQVFSLHSCLTVTNKHPAWTTANSACHG